MGRFDYFIGSDSVIYHCAGFGGVCSSVFSSESQSSLLALNVRFRSTLSFFLSKCRVVSSPDGVSNSGRLVMALSIVFPPISRFLDSLFSMFIVKPFSAFLCFYVIFIKHINSFFSMLYRGGNGLSRYIYDRGWEWCPRNKNYACTKLITEAMVIEEINKIWEDLGMGYGIESTTPEMDKMARRHGPYQNMAIDPNKRKAEFLNPAGKKVSVPLSETQLKEVKSRRAEQEENIKLADKRIASEAR